MALKSMYLEFNSCSQERFDEYHHTVEKKSGVDELSTFFIFLLIGIFFEITTINTSSAFSTLKIY